MDLRKQTNNLEGGMTEDIGRALEFATTTA